MRDPLFCFVLALFVRLAHAAALARTPFLRGPIIDSLTYWQLAQPVARGDGFGGAFYQPPLYPSILALLVRVAGIEPGGGLAIVHSIAGAMTVACIAIIARELFGNGDPIRARRVCLTAGTIAALNGPLVFYDLEILPPAFVHLAIAVALVLATTNASERPSPRDFLSGLLCGIAATGWAHSLVFSPLLIALRARTRRSAAWIGTLVLLGVSIPIATTALYNREHGAPGTLISWNGGLNFWLGNNPDWRDTWRARPGAPFEPISDRPRREGAVLPHDQDRWFRAHAFEYIAAEPLAAIERTLEKLYYVWHGREIRRNQDFEVVRARSPVLAALMWEAGILFFPSGVIVPLAFLSLAVRRRERTPRLLATTLAVYSLAVAAFFVATRYRLPMQLLLVPLAADALVSLAARAFPPRPLAVGVIVLAVALNIPNGFTASFRADARETGLLYAQAYRAARDDTALLRLSDRLLERYPNDPNVQMLAAETAIEQRSDCRRALPHLERVIATAPLATTPWLMTARCDRELGDNTAAERAYANALALDPHLSGALRGAALLYLDAQQRAPAIALLRRLRADRLGDDDTDFDLGSALVESGRTREAREVLEPLHHRRPDDHEVEDLLEQARSAQP